MALLSNIQRRKQSIHIVLCGGGVRVISALGALKVLEENGYSIASVSGVSAGSLIGAVICSGVKPNVLCNWITENDLMKYAGKQKFSILGLRFLHKMRWPFAQYSESGFPKLFIDLAKRDPTFSELSIPFMTAALDITNHEYVIYSVKSCPDKRVAEVLRISTAVPMWYEPVEYENRILVDIAVATRNPVWLTSQLEDDLPIVVLNPQGAKSERPKEIGDFLGTLFQACTESNDRYTMEMIIKRIPNIHTVNLDTKDIPWDKFSLTRKERIGLLEEGANRMLELMNELDGDFSLPNLDFQSVDSDADVAMTKLFGKTTPDFFGTYKAFVSSTYVDLIEHRKYVISVLQRAGIFVDPMECWSADIRPPQKMSTERLDGCNLCILLVGLRRGHVPNGSELSITQMEFEEALKRKMDVLVFMLREDAPWPHKYDELHTDPEVRAWRDTLDKSDSYTVSYFGLEPRSIEIAPAISRWFSAKLKELYDQNKAS